MKIKYYILNKYLYYLNIINDLNYKYKKKYEILFTQIYIIWEKKRKKEKKNENQRYKNK